MRKCSFFRRGGRAAAMLVLAAAASVAWAQGPYHIAATWTVGGDGGWDYLSVDPVSHHLYITRGNHVMVISSEDGHLIADITGLHGTHGVAFDTDGKTGYITDGKGNQVAVFNRATNKIEKTIPAGLNPDGVTFEPVTRSVWAFNGHSKNATVIDAASKKVIATVALPGKPEFPVADGKGNVYDNIEDKSEIVRINAKSHQVTGIWPLAPCESPSGLSIDRRTDRLFSVCDNKTMAIVDAHTGKVIATPAIGDGPDADRFSPKDKYAISSNGEGTLTVIHEDSPDHFTAVQTLATRRGARTMAMMPDGSKLFTVTAQFGPRPAPTADNPHPRPAIVPGTFVVLEITK
jgi:YVTN family beta-propeller protein